MVAKTAKVGGTGESSYHFLGRHERDVVEEVQHLDEGFTISFRIILGIGRRDGVSTVGCPYLLRNGVDELIEVFPAKFSRGGGCDRYFVHERNCSRGRTSCQAQIRTDSLSSPPEPTESVESVDSL